MIARSMRSSPESSTIELAARAPASHTMLSLYLREAAAYSVMDREEELQAALAVEATEVAHWVALLSYSPLVERVLDQLRSDIQVLPEQERPGLPHLERLRELAQTNGQRQSLSPHHKATWTSCSQLLAHAIRLPDLDRRWVSKANLMLQSSIRDEPTAQGINVAGSPDCQALLRNVSRTAHGVQTAKHRFIMANLRLVVNMARHYARGSMPLLDLIQEGNVGLIKAVDRFDHTRGYRFSTFALWWIRHEIVHAIVDKGRTVRIPEHLLLHYAQATRVAEALIARTGRTPTIEELERRTQIPRSTLEHLARVQLRAPLSIDHEHGSERPWRVVDGLTDPDSLSPQDFIEQKSQFLELQSLVHSLSPSDARLIRLRFGWDDDELSLQQLSNRYRLSREGVRRRLVKVLRKLRKQLYANR